MEYTQSKENSQNIDTISNKALKEDRTDNTLDNSIDSSIHSRIHHYKEIDINTEDIPEDIESMIINDLEKLVGEETKIEAKIELVKIISTIIPALDEPVILLDSLVEVVRKKDRVSVYALQPLVLILSEYSGSVTDFFEIFFDLLRVDLFESDREQLVLMCSLIVKAENISLKIARAIAKRLAHIALRVNLFCAIDILRIISVILSIHKNAVVTYKNRETNTGNISEYHNYQGYLFELDALKDHPILGEYARAIKSNQIIRFRTDQQIAKEIEHKIRSTWK
ncbi:hypothetical protein NEOKW01_1853 [Nematocida sp. AWRm80]|nr:hypothetical protein NEOKW01_1853 [Nematocida sp. AWRm80]